MNEQDRISVAIIEDQAPALEAMKLHLAELAGEGVILPEGAIGRGVEEGLNVIARFRPEIVFLDIKLGNSDAFELLERVGEIDFFVIITTAYPKLGKEVINHAPARNIGYLSKPVNPFELEEKIKWYKANRGRLWGESREEDGDRTGSGPRRYHVLESRRGIRMLRFADLIRFESIPRKGIVAHFYYRKFEKGAGEVLDKTEALENRTLGKLIELLPDADFVMVNQQEIVNLRHVDRVAYKVKAKGIRQDGPEEITVDQVIMNTGAAVTLARGRKQYFLERYQSWTQS